MGASLTMHPCLCFVSLESQIELSESHKSQHNDSCDSDNSTCDSGDKTKLNVISGDQGKDSTQFIQFQLPITWTNHLMKAI